MENVSKQERVSKKVLVSKKECKGKYLEAMKSFKVNTRAQKRELRIIEVSKKVCQRVCVNKTVLRRNTCMQGRVSGSENYTVKNSVIVLRILVKTNNSKEIRSFEPVA